jgi:hypothetical protein
VARQSGETWPGLKAPPSQPTARGMSARDQAEALELVDLSTTGWDLLWSLMPEERASDPLVEELPQVGRERGGSGERIDAQCSQH